MRRLRQPLRSRMRRAYQVRTLVAAMEKAFVAVPPADIKSKQREMLDKFSVFHAEIIDEINDKKTRDDDHRARITGALAEVGMIS